MICKSRKTLIKLFTWVDKLFLKGPDGKYCQHHGPACHGGSGQLWRQWPTDTQTQGPAVFPWSFIYGHWYSNWRRFHTSQNYYFSSDVFWPLKNVKTILSLRAVLREQGRLLALALERRAGCRAGEGLFVFTSHRLFPVFVFVTMGMSVFDNNVFS